MQIPPFLINAADSLSYWVIVKLPFGQSVIEVSLLPETGFGAYSAATSTSVNSFPAFSRLVTSAFAVSMAVIQ